MSEMVTQFSGKGRAYAELSDSSPYARQIFLKRAGMWTGTLPNDVEVANIPIFQDTNPENPSHYYVRYGHGLLFNVTTGEAIDLEASDDAVLRIVWPDAQTRRGTKRH